MKRDKDAHNDIYDTVVSLRFPLSISVIHLRYALLYTGLAVLCWWGYTTDHNRGGSMMVLCALGIISWHGAQYLRNAGWFPHWPPAEIKVEKPKTRPIPLDGLPLDRDEQQRFKSIVEDFNDHDGVS